MHLTHNFTLSEFLYSDTAKRLDIKQNPSLEHILNMAHLCAMVLQPLRDRFGPIRISSGYRNKRLNKAVGGASNSQHLSGEAADIHLPSRAVGMLYFQYLSTLPCIDQLIWEETSTACWIHVSCSRLGTNRHQIINSPHLQQ